MDLVGFQNLNEVILSSLLTEVLAILYSRLYIQRELWNDSSQLD